MCLLTLFCTSLLVGSSFAAGAFRSGRDGFSEAVDHCDSMQQDPCEHWLCLYKICPTDVAKVALSEVCPDRGEAWNGPDYSTRKSHRENEVKSTTKGLPLVDSPCLHGGPHDWSKNDIEAHLYRTAMSLYDQRDHEHYSENMTLRWEGIAKHVCPPRVPEFSDCSSTVTWIYWTLFGNGTDFLNNEKWAAGYTGTLKTHGVDIPNPGLGNLRVGDLCFYYHPMHHVAIYVGKGRVVSHGMDPVGLYLWDYAPVDFCRRYL